MSRTLAAIAVAAFVFSGPGQAPPQAPAPAPPPAAKIAGKWTMTLNMDAITATPAIEFVQDSEKVTGFYTGRYGKFPLEGTMKSRKIAFIVKMEAEGMPTTMTFTGDVAADDESMSGEAEIPGLGAATWAAKREKKSPPDSD